MFMLQCTIPVESSGVLLSLSSCVLYPWPGSWLYPAVAAGPLGGLQRPPQLLRQVRVHVCLGDRVARRGRLDSMYADGGGMDG